MGIASLYTFVYNQGPSSTGESDSVCLHYSVNTRVMSGINGATLVLFAKLSRGYVYLRGYVYSRL